MKPEHELYMLKVKNLSCFLLWFVFSVILLLGCQPDRSIYTKIVVSVLYLLYSIKLLFSKWNLYIFTYLHPNVKEEQPDMKDLDEL